MYKVLVKGDWAKEDAIKSEVKGCAKVPAWIWEKNGDDGWMAAFDLNGSYDESCVSKAVKSAAKGAVRDLPCPVHDDGDKKLVTRLESSRSYH